MAKAEIIQMIREMPDHVTTEEVLYRLYVRTQIEKGLEEVGKGKTIPHDEVLTRLEKWLR